jgi:hypothetical protein
VRIDALAVPCREGSEIVDPVHVVGVEVRDPNRVDAIDSRGEQLESELGRRIDEDPASPIGLEERTMA